MPLEFKTDAVVETEGDVAEDLALGLREDGPGFVLGARAFLSESQGGSGEPEACLSVELSLGLGTIGPRPVTIYIDGVNEIEALRDLLTLAVDQYRRDGAEK